MTSRLETDEPTYQLTTKDFAILEVMHQRRVASGDPILPLLERKIAAATVISADAIEPNVATLNSRVVFRVNGGSAETRTLLQNEVRGFVGFGLPITNMRGLAMLGLSEGQTISTERQTGQTDLILLEKILYQPEATRREYAPQKVEPKTPTRRPALKLVHSVADLAPALGEKQEMLQRRPYDDDPGPSAA